MFALADCNNFYASCERVFQPRLEGKPIVILSNNDGCVISRSEESKSLGIPMGAPYFKFEKMMRENHVHVFSSNYSVYGDFSRRVMQVLSGFAPAMEVYSIDECFLDFSEMPQDLTAYSLEIIRTVRQWTGIPISIGIGPTKTLAKISNRLAKIGFNPGCPVLDWSCLSSLEATLAAIPVEDVWGISSRWGGRLRALGIEDAGALRRAEPKWLRQRFGVVMERIGWELRGVPCLPLETVPPPRKQILTSRSFGEKLTQLDDLRAAVSAFAARAGEKLRLQGLSARALCVFLHTSPFDLSQPQYSNAATLRFDTGCQDSGRLVRAALRGLGRIYRPGLAYQKAGVMLLDLSPASREQAGLFEDSSDKIEKAARRTEALDKINQYFGRHTLRYASELLGNRWQMRNRMKSPCYTTRWDELPVVQAR